MWVCLLDGIIVQTRVFPCAFRVCVGYILGRKRAYQVCIQRNIYMFLNELLLITIKSLGLVSPVAIFLTPRYFAIKVSAYYLRISRLGKCFQI